MFKPVFISDDHGTRIEYVQDPIATPEPITIPSWLMIHVNYVWDLELEAGKYVGKIEAVKLIRNVLNLGLKEAKDVMDALYSKRVNGS